MPALAALPAIIGVAAPFISKAFGGGGTGGSGDYSEPPTDPSGLSSNAIAGLAIGGGGILSSLLGAKQKSDAAKQAAMLQQQYANRAALVQQGVYQQNMAGMQPYSAVGRSAINALGRLTTPGVAYTPQMQAADNYALANAPPTWSMVPGGPASNMPGMPSATSGFGTSGGSYNAGTGLYPSMPNTNPYFGGGGPSTGSLGQLASNLVPLRAPDGSVRAVPQSMVGQFMSQGAVPA
jgi:hypothetical protein